VQTDLIMIELKNNFLYQIEGATRILNTVAIYKNPGAWVGLHEVDGELQAAWDTWVTPVECIAEFKDENLPDRKYNGNGELQGMLIDPDEQTEFLIKHHHQGMARRAA